MQTIPTSLVSITLIPNKAVASQIQSIGDYNTWWPRLIYLRTMRVSMLENP